jgi:hypothetical protein
VLWKRHVGVAGAAREEREDAREVRHVADDHQVEFFAGEERSNPLRRIRWLQSALRGNDRERVAEPTEGFGGLARAEFAAVADDPGLHAACGSGGRKRFGMHPAGGRKRALRIDVGGERLGVMD